MNQVGDISILSSLTQLQHVSLCDNEITSIASLVGLTNLATLQLSGNLLEEEAYCTHLPSILANNPGLIPGDDLTYSANQRPPSNVSASKGTYSDKVVITWDAVCDAVHDPYYRIYCSESLDGEKKPISGYLNAWRKATTFEDEHASPGVTYYYWIMSNTADGNGNYYYYSDFSLHDTGWCGSGGTTYSLNTSSTAGGSVTAPGEGAYAYTPGTSVSIVAAAQAGHEFAEWSGTAVSAGKVADSSAASTTVTVDGNYTLTANFSPTTATTHTLALSSGAGGSVTSPGEGTLSYAPGSHVSIAATPNAGYEFAGWSGTAVSAGKVANASAASPTVTVDGDYSLTASFALAQTNTCTLSVSAGDGGSVATPGLGTFTYDPGEVVSIRAAADSGYSFAGWTGTAVSAGKVANASAASTMVTMDGDYTLTASFQGEGHTLEVSATAGGWVVTPGEGSFSYSHGESVTLEAQAQPGYHFVEWSGSLCSSSYRVSIEMSSDHHVTANFAPDPQTLTVSSGTGGSVVMPGEGVFLCGHGDRVRAVAVPDAGYGFAGWTGDLVEDGAVEDPNQARVDCILAADGTLHASFAPALRCIYVDDDAPADPMPGDAAGSDPAEDGTADHPFDMIQEGIDAAVDGQCVLVCPGTYYENVDFAGKGIVVSSLDPHQQGGIDQTVVHGGDLGSVVTFQQGEGADSVLLGLTLTGGYAESGAGIWCDAAGPVIANCVIAGNRAESGAGLFLQDSDATVVNCTVSDNYGGFEGSAVYCSGDVTIINSIIWKNTPKQIIAEPQEAVSVSYSNVRGGWPGAGNLDDDPHFAREGSWVLASFPDIVVFPNNPDATWLLGDYHLASQQGRWEPTEAIWVADDLSSPCIDAGNPQADVKAESISHGGRLNIGAFGGTADASRSPAEVSGE